MKKVTTIMTLGIFLTTGSIYAGGIIAPTTAMVKEIPSEVNPIPFYIGVGLLWANTSSECGVCHYIDTGLPRIGGSSVEDDAWGGIIRGGYEYNQYIGIEARALKASINDDLYETTHYGIFFKPTIPISEQINVYGLLGYGWTEITAEGGCMVSRETYDYDGFSYGIGIEYDFSDRESDREDGEYDRLFDGQADQEKGWGLWLDYQNLMNNEGPHNFESSIVTFGVTYDF
jgi:OOP family OmpA-OmpF porin